MTKAFKRQLAGYLSSLMDMVETQCHGDGLECLTLLDRHRMNLCRREVEGVLERIKANGELGDNRLLGIAMTHAYKHLRTIRRLLDEVSFGFIIKMYTLGVIKSSNYELIMVSRKLLDKLFLVLWK